MDEEQTAADGAVRAPGGPRTRAGSRTVARYGSAALALIVAGAAAAACSNNNGTGSLASGSSAQGGTLTVASPSAPTSLDPAVSQPSDEKYSDLAYTPLIIQGPSGNFTPGLATSWSYGPDNKSFTIKLRPGVKFSDGTPLNAAAVKTWLQHEMKPGNGGASYLSNLTSVDVTGPQTLTLNFSKPTPDLQMVFGQTLALGMIGSPKAVAAGTLTKQTAGAGPYMLDSSATVSGATYTYVPNPNYYDKSAQHWSKVVVKVIASPTAALQALQSGQVQVAMDQPVTSVPAATKSGLKSVDPLTLLLGLGILDRDGKVSKPLANVQVRQALNYAIDRPALAKVLGSGYGTPISQMAAPGWDSYDAALEQAYPYNPAKAKQMLAAAGYPNGFTMPVVSVAAVGQDVLVNALQGQLAQVGITVKPDITSNTGSYFQAMSSGNYPAATLSFGRLPAAFDYADLYGPAAAFNPFKTSSSQLTALDGKLNAASASAEPDIAKQMQALLVNQAWFVPVAATPLVVLYNSSVTGVNASAQRNVVYMTEIKAAG
jgi:peptide/nickel transport system substrate-binding protein